MFDSAGLEVLDRAECIRLLRSVSLGRIVFTDQALPAVQPVRFAVLDGDQAIVFRTSQGSKLSAAARNAIVAFEVDSFNDSLNSGWSVALVGHASEVLDAHVLREVERFPLDTWGPGGRGHVIRVSIERISGRRVQNAPQPVVRAVTG